MTIRLVTDEKIAGTSSKGNQEKWYDQAADCWYKLDQFGYEALAKPLFPYCLSRAILRRTRPSRLYAIIWSDCKSMAGSAQDAPAGIFYNLARRLLQSIVCCPVIWENL